MTYRLSFNRWSTMQARRRWRRRRTRAARRERTADFYARIAPGVAVQEHWGNLVLRPSNGYTYGRIVWGRGRASMQYRTLEPTR